MHITNPVSFCILLLMALDIPVVLFIFKRPSLTEKVFAKIAEAQPRKLFVIADGPRCPEEAQKCQAARSIVEKVDWHCELITDFAEENIGCDPRIAGGLDWVFSQVEAAIILEDDCLPTASFFPFCQELLTFYKDDTRVMHVSGTNFQDNQSRTRYGYYFSKFTQSHGWGTWSRAWKYHDYEMRTFPEFRETGMIKNICDDPYEQRYFMNIFEAHKEWDSQWLYTCWVQHGLSVIPKCNLVSNIGYGVDSTHTHDANHPYANLPTSDLWQIEHPPFVVRNKEADEYVFNMFFGGKSMKQRDRALYKIRRSFSFFKRKGVGFVRKWHHRFL